VSADPRTIRGILDGLFRERRRLRKAIDLEANRRAIEYWQDRLAAARVPTRTGYTGRRSRM
jgi:hypothetical protein